MRPWPKFAAKSGADELCDDAHVLFRQTEHLCEHGAHVEDGLRFLVDRELAAVPHRGCSLQLDGNMRFGRCDVSLVELDPCAGKGPGRIAALALQALHRPVGGHDRVRIIIGGELVFDVRFLFRVGNDNRVRRSFGALESVRHRERDVLTVVANDIVLERRPPFDADAVDALPESRTENLPYVLTMQNRAHAEYLLRCGTVDLSDLSNGNRGLDRNGI